MAPELHSPRVNWVKLAAVKRFLSLAETTKKREPAQLVVGGKYRVGKKISNGAFGQLRLVTDIITGEDLAIKLEPENAKSMNVKGLTVRSWTTMNGRFSRDILRK